MNEQHWYCEACGKTGWFPTDDNADVLIVMDASLKVHALTSPDCREPWAVHLGTPPVEPEVDDGLQYALDVAICALQEIFEAAGRDGKVFYETRAYAAIDTIAVILTADQQKHWDVVNESQARVESR